MLTAEQIAQKTDWTYADYALLPDELRCEILDGELLMSPSPRTLHQLCSMELSMLLWEYVRKNNLGKIVTAPMDVHLDARNIVQPDILFVSSARKNIIERDGIIRGVPDVAIEIVSPTSVVLDRGRKMQTYLRFGLPEYWIVDPANQSIEVYTLTNGQYVLASGAAQEGVATSVLISGFSVDVKSFFASLEI